MQLGFKLPTKKKCIILENKRLGIRGDQHFWNSDSEIHFLGFLKSISTLTEY